VHDRHDLSDEQWARLEPLLPDTTPRRGGRWADHRSVVNGVLWRTRTGCPWRDLPASYGHWKTIYNRHRRWSGEGTWEKVLDGLRVGVDATEAQWVVSVDSTVVRAHAHAAGARHAPPADITAARLASVLAERSAPTPAPTGGAVE
jgi:transposase